MNPPLHLPSSLDRLVPLPIEQPASTLGVAQCGGEIAFPSLSVDGPTVPHPGQRPMGRSAVRGEHRPRLPLRAGAGIRRVGQDACLQGQ